MSDVVVVFVISIGEEQGEKNKCQRKGVGLNVSEQQKAAVLCSSGLVTWVITTLDTLCLFVF